MWILVLTVLGYTSQNGPAVAAVPGFTSQATCQAAAVAWTAQVNGEQTTELQRWRFALRPNAKVSG